MDYQHTEENAKKFKPELSGEMAMFHNRINVTLRSQAEHFPRSSTIRKPHKTNFFNCVRSVFITKILATNQKNSHKNIARK